jgi:hypothetical protein
LKFQHPAIQTKVLQHFGGFFHEIKVLKPIGRKDSLQTMCPRRRRFLHEAAQNFDVFSNIQDQNLKVKFL